LGKGNLFRGFQGGDEIADIVAREIFEEAFGHHRHGRGFAGEDRGFGDDRILADEAEGELLIVFGDDVPGEHAAVLGVNCDEFVGFLDLFAGGDDRREDIVEVGAVGVGFLLQAEVRAQAAENPQRAGVMRKLERKRVGMADTSVVTRWGTGINSSR
jgi:hypothetical protein